MNQKIQLSKFIISLIIIMGIILFLYLVFVIPKIRPMCSKSDSCASTINCECIKEKCMCQYINIYGEIENIKCVSNN